MVCGLMDWYIIGKISGNGAVPPGNPKLVAFFVPEKLQRRNSAEKVHYNSRQKFVAYCNHVIGLQDQMGVKYSDIVR